MLIAHAEVWGSSSAADVRIVGGRIAATGKLRPEPGERVLDAGGGALLPGLHDHHLHLFSYAAALHSVACGPPQIMNEAALAAALAKAAPAPPDGWIRGVGYHESAAGDIDRHWLDRCRADVPVRIQHRSGRLWVVNSVGLKHLTAAGETPPSNGRLYDQDLLLRRALGAVPPPVSEASRRLAACGVTGITDMTPQNDSTTFETFAFLQASGHLRQQVRLAGSADLQAAAGDERLAVGETKFHLHESALPSFAALCRDMAASHRAGRRVAVHCVTEAELVFALAALADAGALPGDRIEHASVTPPALLEQMQALGVTVVTQPNFIAERGEAYLTDVPVEAHPWLYRCRGFLDAGVPCAGGTDAPFGDADPWRAMAAAVSRRTASGRLLGPDERLTPEQALALFLGRPEAPTRMRLLAPGEPADLCLLDVPWAIARHSLSSRHVRATVIGGDVAWMRPNPDP